MRLFAKSHQETDAFTAANCTVTAVMLSSQHVSTRRACGVEDWGELDTPACCRTKGKSALQDHLRLHQFLPAVVVLLVVALIILIHVVVVIFVALCMLNWCFWHCSQVF